MMTLAEEFSHRTFTAPKENIRNFCDLVMSRLDPEEKLRVLDIGCGTGSLIFSMAEKLKHAHFVGVDISAPNIEAAKKASMSLGQEDRFDFICGDYLRRQMDSFDVVLSYSVLQNIEAPAKDLFGKISSELKSGGIFVNYMPYECWQNHTIYVVRSFLRKIRGSWTDAFLLGAAKLVHGSRMSEGILRERIFYSYLLPEHLDGAALRGRLKTLGLDFVAEYPEKQTRLGKPKHKITIFRKGNAS